MTDLEAAWNAVHENTPNGWYVAKHGCEERYGQWSMYAFDPSEKAVNGMREQQWTAGAERTGTACWRWRGAWVS